jgi:hypothetical protein
MTPILSAVLIAVGSVPVLWISRRSLLKPSSFGFYRFFAVESILALRGEQVPRQSSLKKSEPLVRIADITGQVVKDAPRIRFGGSSSPGHQKQSVALSPLSVLRDPNLPAEDEDQMIHLSRFRNGREELIVDQVFCAQAREMAEVICHTRRKISLHPAKTVQHEITFPVPVIALGLSEGMLETKGMS